MATVEELLRLDPSNLEKEDVNGQGPQGRRALVDVVVVVDGVVPPPLPPSPPPPPLPILLQHLHPPQIHHLRGGYKLQFVEATLEATNLSTAQLLLPRPDKPVLRLVLPKHDGLEQFDLVAVKQEKDRDPELSMVAQMKEGEKSVNKLLNLPAQFARKQ